MDVKKELQDFRSIAFLAFKLERDRKKFNKSNNFF